MKRGMRKQLQGDAAGRLQLSLGWLSVVESVDMKLTQLPLPIARLRLTILASDVQHVIYIDQCVCWTRC